MFSQPIARIGSHLKQFILGQINRRVPILQRAHKLRGFRELQGEFLVARSLGGMLQVVLELL